MEINECTFCSVRMLGTGVYIDENTGEMVHVDYIKNTDAYCKAHCKNYRERK